MSNVNEAGVNIKKTKRTVNMDGFDELPDAEKREIVREEIRSILQKKREGIRMSFGTALMITACNAIAFCQMGHTLIGACASASIGVGLVAAGVNYFADKRDKKAIQDEINVLQSASNYVFTKEQMENEVEVARAEMKNNSSLNERLMACQQGNNASQVKNNAVFSALRGGGR